MVILRKQGTWLGHRGILQVTIDYGTEDTMNSRLQRSLLGDTEHVHITVSILMAPWVLSGLLWKPLRSQQTLLDYSVSQWDTPMSQRTLFCHSGYSHITVGTTCYSKYFQVMLDTPSSCWSLPGYSGHCQITVDIPMSKWTLPGHSGHSQVMWELVDRKFWLGPSVIHKGQFKRWISCWEEHKGT